MTWWKPGVRMRVPRPRSWPVAVKLAAPLLAVGAVLAGVGTWASHGYYRAQLREQVLARAQLLSSAVSYAAEVNGASPALVRIVNALSGEPDVKAVVVVGGTDRRVIACSRNGWIGLPVDAVPDARTRRDLAALPAEPAGHFEASADDFTLVSPLFVAGPAGPDEQAGAVRVLIDGRPVAAALRRSAWMTSGFLSGALLIAVLTTAAVLRRVVLRRVRAIREAMDRQAAGDHTARAPVDGTDEIDAVAAALNGMVDGLRASTERLRESEEINRRILESSIDCVKTLDLDGRLLWMNEAGRRLMEITDFEAVAGRPWAGFWPGGGRDLAAGAVAAAAAAGTASTFDAYCPTAAGTPKWWNVIVTAVTDGRGRPERLLAVSRDVTRQHRDAEALAYQKTLLEAQGEASPDGFLVISPDGRIVSHNRRFVEMWGIPAGVMAGGSDAAARASVAAKVEDFDAFEATVRRWMADPDTRGRDEVRLRDGRVFDRHTAPVRGADGTYYGRVWFFRDVSEERRAAEALRESEERYQLVAKATNDVTWDWDLRTGGLQWNAGGGGSVFGYDLRDTAGGLDWWTDRIHPDDRDRVAASFARLVGSGETAWSAEYRFLTASGGYAHVFDRAYVARRSDGTVERVVGAMQDLTERKRAAEVERERNALRDAVAAMEQVLGVVGHELRTPLAALRAMSEFLLEPGAASSPQAPKFLGRINAEAVRMAETVNNLLEAARMNSGRARWNWSEFAVADAVGEAASSIRPLLDESKVALTWAVDPSVARMRGDADAVRRLVLNLLSNARTHTARGAIAVRAEGGADGTLVLRVSDTGEGIPPEILGKLGEAFALNAGSVGTNYVGGTGLGLAICKGIAAAHGGRISVASTPGEGTEVTVRLRADLDGPVHADARVELVRAAAA